MNTRPRRDHIRKPKKKAILGDISENMAHFSRVARKPVWFSFSNLWDIHKETRRILTGKAPRSMTSNLGFPNAGSFGLYARKHPNIKTKKTIVKINHELSRSSENTKIEFRYAYIHPGQDAAEGVDFGGIQ